MSSFRNNSSTTNKGKRPQQRINGEGKGAGAASVSSSLHQATSTESDHKKGDVSNAFFRKFGIHRKAVQEKLKRWLKDDSEEMPHVGAAKKSGRKKGLDGNDFADFLEEDDMGLGVSNTVKNKKPRTPKPEEVEERENVILELATAAQDVADSLKPEDEFDKYKARGGNKEDEGATARAIVTGEEEEEDGMGISETVTSGSEEKRTFRKEDIALRAVATIQSGDQIEEMERLAAKDVRRAQMLEKGLSKEQIAAYLGDDLSEVPKSRAEKIGETTLEAYQRSAVEEASAWRDEQALLQVAASSSLVKLDENGNPFEDRFVYVDEYTCIGCTHCSHAAPSTFFMEEEYGRARVYQQGKDTEEAVCEAILTCPVDCIHYVDWPELKRLETEREGIDINFKAKLVGNDHDNRANGMQLISGNQGMRCENCPSKGCYNCPMFGVGFNPEYKKRQEERKAKREARLKKQQEEISGEVRSADL